MTSVLLHALNTVLVFLFVRSVTGAFWRSALVAALFGLHPLHVESVAWVAERKDVLSTCFGLVSLIFCARYGRKRLADKSRDVKAQEVPASRTLDYLFALIFFALGLMSNWKNSETLFEHTLEVTENHHIAHYNLGNALVRKGQTDEAIRQYHEVVRLKPDYAEAHSSLARALAMKNAPAGTVGQGETSLTQPGTESRPLSVLRQPDTGPKTRDRLTQDFQPVSPRIARILLAHVPRRSYKQARVKT